MRKFVLLLPLMLFFYSKFTMAEELLQQVIVADPFIEVHSGHGESYPVFHVIERGEVIEIVLRHAAWFKIRSANNIEGWVALDEMSKTLSTDQTAVEFDEYSHEDYEKRQWELSLLGGRFGSANTTSIQAAYYFNKIMAAELSVGQAIGNTSSSTLYRVSLLMQPFPSFRISPYLALGTGFIQTKPKTTLVQPDDTSNQLSYISIGIRSYLSKRIIARLEYSDYVIFSANLNNDINEDIKEWKAGIAIFF